MMAFRTILDRQRIRANPGSRFADTYSLKIMDDGTKDLVVTGKVDTYAKIQTYKESCDIHVILERFVNGDESALSVNTPSFGDFTDYPTTYAEMLQRVNDAESLFGQLPLDIRKEFNHNAGEFFASIGSEKYNNVMQEYYKPPGQDSFADPVVETPVNEPIVQKEVISDVKKSE